jgi:hypothetical protein
MKYIEKAYCKDLTILLTIHIDEFTTLNNQLSHNTSKTLLRDILTILSDYSLNNDKNNICISVQLTGTDTEGATIVNASSSDPVELKLKTLLPGEDFKVL